MLWAANFPAIKLEQGTDRKTQAQSKRNPYERTKVQTLSHEASGSSNLANMEGER